MKPALTCLALSVMGAAAVAAEKVSFIKIDGAIGPATASYISRSIDEAQTQHAQCLVIQLNTPGGLLESTQTIVQSFLGSPVPVVVTWLRRARPRPVPVASLPLPPASRQWRRPRPLVRRTR